MTRARTITVPCPQCGSRRRRRIMWGLVARPLTEQEERKYVLGGCCVPPDDPTHECDDCGTRYRARRELLEMDERLAGDTTPEQPQDG